MLVYCFADLSKRGGLEDFLINEILREGLVLSATWPEKLHTVIIRVFDGGDGCTNGGRSERSRESGDLEPDDARERCGEGVEACILAIIWKYVYRDGSGLCIVSMSLLSVEQQNRDSPCLISKVAF